MLRLTVVVLSLLLLTVLRTVVQATYSAFTLKLEPDMSVAKTKVEVAKVVNDAVRDKELLLVYASKDLAGDGYASLYAGWLRHVFTSPRFRMRFLFVDAGSEENFPVLTGFLLSVLPRESIFASFDHGLFVRRPKELAELKATGRVADFGLFHLNHERPWAYNVSNIFHNDYDSEEALLAAYRGHGLVFRNYFHEPLQGDSDTSYLTPAPKAQDEAVREAAGRDTVQLPVGPSYYNYWLGNAASLLTVDKPASQRGIGCRFIGRKRYADSEEYSIPQRNALFEAAGAGARLQEPPTVFDDDEDDALAHAMGFEAVMAEVGRLRMYTMSGYGGPDADAPLPCEVFVYPRRIPLNYEFYLKILVETAFVPCPPGNSPETFRHYEALEAGAIPLMLDGRAVPHSEYLQSNVWAGFPAPTFESWAAAGDFVRKMLADPTGLDALQAQVQAWYRDSFKTKLRAQVDAAVAKHYPALLLHEPPQGLQSCDERQEEPKGAAGECSCACGGVSAYAAAAESELQRQLEAQREVTARLQVSLSDVQDVLELLKADLGTVHGGLLALMEGHNIYGGRLSRAEATVARIVNAQAEIAAGRNQEDGIK